MNAVNGMPGAIDYNKFRGPENKDIKEIKPVFDNSIFDKEQAKITKEGLISEVNELLKKPGDTSTNVTLFQIKTANQWLKEANLRPIPKMLFGELWHEGELCILFADTNLGKSILAVQIADSISRGEPVKSFKLEADLQIVLYLDFELSDKQFEVRYSVNFQNHYLFNENFFRAEMDPENVLPESFETFEDYLNFSLEEAIKKTGVKILIVDNLTYLKNDNEKAKDALPLMKHLKALKKKYGLSILALAHTPKRDMSKPITRNDLQGSKMLINFCDSSFSIGESCQDKNIRYLKQIKARNTEIIYDAENVCVCHISKETNFLNFELLDFGREKEHLKPPSEKEKSELEDQVRNLITSNPEYSSYGIAKELCHDESKFNSFKVKISRIVNKIKNSNN